MGRIADLIDKGLARIGAVPLLLIVSLALLLPGFTSLPPMDRDEPRFAEASKQMLETSDFVSIRFGDEARNKKPVGIHWLQAASLAAAEALGVPDARHAIWVYRIPSLVGALLAVLLTYWAALPFVPRAGALLAGVFVAATPLLGVEARLATTDAVLTATVVAAMGALARLYLAQDDRRGRMIGTAGIFWIAIGIGILIKGPITPLIPALAIVVLAVKDRSAGWLRGLRPLPGLVVCLLIVLPWFVLILIRTQGAFFADAVGHDMLGKVGGAQESHGAPPGFYALAFSVTAWPLAPFAALAVPSIWRARRERDIAFLLAWALPFWLVLEAVPTKLVHYVLPLYPAFAILAVLSLLRGLAVARRVRPAGGWVVFALLALLPVFLGALVVAGQGYLWTLDAGEAALAVLAVLCALALAWAARRALLDGRLAVAGGFAVLCGLPIYAFAYGLLLTPGVAGSLAVAQRLVEQASAALGPGCPTRGYATVGDREPSLMFETDAGLLMTDPVGAAHFLDDGTCRVAFVDAADQGPFTAALKATADIRLASRVEGIALNGGRALDIGVYVRP